MTSSANQDNRVDPQQNASQSDIPLTEEEATDALAADVQSARQGSVEEVQRLSNELQQANDRTLRAQAELENFRRRMRREMEDERKYAFVPLIADLLAVVDNLDRAVDAAEKSEGGSGLLQGVKMVQSLFVSVLERHHCRRIGEVGATFDPNEHQAIAQEPSSEIATGSVTRVAQFGYRLHDRVVRPAQVMVSTGSPS